VNKKKRSILLGVIPARAGSKGIKNKNLRDVLGKPLIYYTIKQSAGYKGIYKIIVTTDSTKIAKAAEKFGAEVPFIRPKALAKDLTPMLDVLRHALINCERIYSVRIDGIVLLDPTSPVRKKETIDNMLKIFLNGDMDMMVAVTRSRRNPYFNMLKLKKDGYAALAIKGSFVRRQDAPVFFDITNSCWIFSRRAVMARLRMPPKTRIYETDDFFIDIDTKDNLKLFECYLEWERRYGSLFLTR